MKTKAAKIFSDCKYGLIVFVALVVQAVMNMIPFRSVGEYLHVYYLVDFSMGKTSRLLIGTIVNWLTDNPDIDWVNSFVVAFVFVSLLFSSILAGKVINGVKKELKPHVLVFTLFLVSGSFTFANFSKFLGFFDIFMFLIALTAIVFLHNRYLQWLVPVLCVVGVFIHQGFVFSFFPLIILASLYKITVSEKKVQGAAVFCLTAVLTVAAVAFCVLFGTKTINLPYEDMCAIVNERGSREFSEEALSNLGFYFYDHAPVDSGISDIQFSELSFFETYAVLTEYINTSVAGSSKGMIAILSLAILLFALFWIIWIKCIKNTDNKGKRFVYVCFMLATLIVPMYCIIAADYIRWVQAGMLTQFAFAFIMFYTKDEPFEKAVTQIGDYFRSRKMFLVIIYLVYALAVQRDLTG